MTYYDILDVDRDATQDEIKSAYRELVKEIHPDNNDSPDAEDKFKKVDQSYTVLKDPESRKEYDEALDSNLGKWESTPNSGTTTTSTSTSTSSTRSDSTSTESSGGRTGDSDRDVDSGGYQEQTSRTTESDPTAHTRGTYGASFIHRDGKRKSRQEPSVGVDQPIWKEVLAYLGIFIPGYFIFIEALVYQLSPNLGGLLLFSGVYEFLSWVIFPLVFGGVVAGVYLAEVFLETDRRLSDLVTDRIS